MEIQVDSHWRIHKINLISKTIQASFESNYLVL